MSRLFFFSLIAIISCNATHDKERQDVTIADSTMILKPTFESIAFNNKVKDVVKEFITEDKCTDCVHEMYIDKIHPNQSTIVLKSRVYSAQYLNGINPLFITKINGIDFYIFSGLEDIFVGDRKKISYTTTDTTNGNYRVWSLIIQSDSIKVEKDIGKPFFPAEPPNIEIRK